eukprot:TRINITY_DN9249_c0_g1_i2.p1 TRINITY_DN9249_c0_g1~~TRINITY_DN9249_c0_g1_i2.p1  ORF type:complete len:865 (+),score=138.85 TRINITY_DN9249_c0_g1_i2:1714-4308(+)
MVTRSSRTVRKVVTQASLASASAELRFYLRCWVTLAREAADVRWDKRRRVSTLLATVDAANAVDMRNCLRCWTAICRRTRTEREDKRWLWLRGAEAAACASGEWRLRAAIGAWRLEVHLQEQQRTGHAASAVQRARIDGLSLVVHKWRSSAVGVPLYLIVRLWRRLSLTQFAARATVATATRAELRLYLRCWAVVRSRARYRRQGNLSFIHKSTESADRADLHVCFRCWIDVRCQARRARQHKQSILNLGTAAAEFCGEWLLRAAIGAWRREVEREAAQRMQDEHVKRDSSWMQKTLDGLSAAALKWRSTAECTPLVLLVAAWRRLARRGRLPVAVEGLMNGVVEHAGTAAHTRRILDRWRGEVTKSSAVKWGCRMEDSAVVNFQMMGKIRRMHRILSVWRLLTVKFRSTRARKLAMAMTVKMQREQTCALEQRLVLCCWKDHVAAQKKLKNTRREIGGACKRLLGQVVETQLEHLEKAGCFRHWLARLRKRRSLLEQLAVAFDKSARLSMALSFGAWKDDAANAKTAASRRTKQTASFAEFLTRTSFVSTPVLLQLRFADWYEAVGKARLQADLTKHRQRAERPNPLAIALNHFSDVVAGSWTVALVFTSWAHARTVAALQSHGENRAKSLQAVVSQHQQADEDTHIMMTELSTKMREHNERVASLRKSMSVTKFSPSKASKAATDSAPGDSPRSGGSSSPVVVSKEGTPAQSGDHQFPRILSSPSRKPSGDQRRLSMLMEFDKMKEELLAKKDAAAVTPKSAASTSSRLLLGPRGDFSPLVTPRWPLREESDDLSTLLVNGLPPAAAACPTCRCWSAAYGDIVNMEAKVQAEAANLERNLADLVKSSDIALQVLGTKFGMRH